MQSLIELINVEKVYPSDPPVKPLDSLSLIVPPGEVVAITGASGKGKSTLLGIIGRILSPSSGLVIFKGEDITTASSGRLDELHKGGIGFIFQIPHLFQALTTLENLVFSRKVRGLDTRSETILPILEGFGLQDRKDHLPSELSVGQKRRLVIAQVISAEHDLILADEPTNDLDAEWSGYVFDRFREYVKGSARSVVVVTHDDTYARRADVVYTLNEGKLLPQGRDLA